MTNKEPLDKKIVTTSKMSCFLALDIVDVKSSLSNLKKRLKEEIRVNPKNKARKGQMVDILYCEDIIDKLFSEEIGSGLLEGENEKQIKTIS